MSKPHKTISSAGDDRNLVAVDENYLAPTFEDKLRIFWEKNSRAVVVACALVFVVILGKGAYEYNASRRERALGEDFAAARVEGDAALKAFADSNASHVLGGLAQLELADKAYSEGNYAEAAAAYDRAAGILKQNLFGQRARLGSAMSALLGGKTAEGEAALKQISIDMSLGKIVRAEAAYHLASRAAESGDAAEAIRLIEQTTVIDPEGPWADRASMLRSTLPATAAPAASEGEGDSGVGENAAVEPPSVSFQ